VVGTTQPGLADSGRGNVADVVRLGVLAACLRDGAFPAGAWAGKLRPAVGVGVGDTLGPGLGLPDGPGLGELDGLGLGLGLPPWLGGHLVFPNAIAATMPWL